MGVKRISSESENVCSKKVKIELEEGIHVQARKSETYWPWLDYSY